MITIDGLFEIIKTILITILVFGGVIFIHELGHFLMAKAMGVRVDEFAVGMGPAIVKFGKKETKYALRLFPIGGFVSMPGEDEESDDERAHCNKPVWRRMLITVGGVMMNFLLGFIILIIIAAPQTHFASTTIAEFDSNALSHQTGLEIGDKITSINGVGVLVDYDFTFNMQRDNDGIMDIGVIRNGEHKLLKNVTFYTEKGENGVQYIKYDFRVASINNGFFPTIRQAALKTVSFTKVVWLSLVDLVTGNVGMEQLSGPVGTATVIGQAASVSLDYFFILIAIISINLGVMNLLPIPALDGGRLLFQLVELITRKKIPAKYEGWIHAAGFALLILLMIFVTYNDVARIISGG